MVVVSDASVVINLAAVGQLDLLHQLFGSVLIPQAVYDEIVVAGKGLPGAESVARLAWIETRSVADRSLVEGLLLELDLGEAESIALARECDCDFLLIDERRGRAAAERLGIRVIGLLGVLVQAKRVELITSVRPTLDSLRSSAGFWIHDELYRRILEAVDEH